MWIACRQALNLTWYRAGGRFPCPEEKRLFFGFHHNDAIRYGICPACFPVSNVFSVTVYSL
jgi:hypothetical protein